jgi:hypothetical protein
MTPRLLDREAAAEYLSISSTYFEQHVARAVVPVLIGNRRRWDVRALDEWLDGKRGLAHAPAPAEQWLERLDADAAARHQ